MRDVASALRYLHSRTPKVVHGDLKSGNIFVESCRELPIAKLLDFGLSRLLTRNAKPLGGTLVWMAPEVVARKKGSVDTPSDVFSFGCVMLFCLTGLKPPISRGHDERLELFPQYASLISACSEEDPSLRPTMTHVHLLVAETSPENKQTGKADWSFALEEARNKVSQQCVARNTEPQERHKENDGNQVEHLLMHKGFQATPKSSLMRAIVAEMMHWNLEMPPTPCCSFHQAVKCAREVCLLLSACCCRSDCAQPPCGQCKECQGLVLNDQEKICNSCNGSVRCVADACSLSCSN